MDLFRGQQGLVIDAIRRAGRPLSAEEARDHLPAGVRIGAATAYRAVKRGAAEGVLEAVRVNDGPTRYEPAGAAHHHHFECDRCRRVHCVRGCPAGIEKMAPEGFRLRAHEIVLRGLCRQCSGEVAG